MTARSGPRKANDDFGDAGTGIRYRLERRGVLRLVEETAFAYGVLLEELFRPGRGHASVGWARHHIWAELYSRGTWSYPRLGELFGRDHTTILEGVRAHHRRMGTVAA